MESTIRWHESNCSNPSVIIQNDVPICYSCGATSSVLVARLVARNVAKGGDIHLPADTPLDKANFWWPRSVPYSSSLVDASTNSRPGGGQREAVMPSGRGTDSSYVSPVYPSSLDSSHFRLIYLSESENFSSPIHIRLEEYDLNDHPEYETVSYVWGGENADSTLCKPIFVSRYWDAILTTSNCSALLRHLRRREISRVIWLDAICINQADNKEKPAQISRMGDIYSNCERVVAYLGEDLVSPPTSGRNFRSRIDFRKATLADPMRSDMDRSAEFHMTCAKAAGMTQRKLFKRRYLTRIWIVQEILLSKSAMFPLGSSDILCDREQARRLILRTDQENFSLSSVTKSLSLLLKATSHCHASDPRDRVYGLLGLYKPQGSLHTLVSGYSISWRDCWVGTAAYLLLVEKNLALLSHAVGNTRPPHVPSWVPDIQNAGSWLVDLTSIVNGKEPRPSKGSHRTKPVRTTASEKWKLEFVMHSVEEEELMSTAMGAKSWWEQETHRLVHQGALHTLSTDSASVMSSNGALQLQALRIFGNPRQLTVEHESNGLTSIWVRSASAAAHFRVMGLKDTMDQHESYQLFVITHRDLTSPESSERGPRASNTVLLALTTVLPGNNRSIVTLHECCMVYDIHLYSMGRFKASQGDIDRATNAMHSLHWILYNLHEVLMSSYAVRLGHDWIFASAFPSTKARTRDILPLMMFLTNQKFWRRWLDYAEPVLAAAKTICPDFDPKTEGNYLYLTVKNEKMFTMLSSMWEARRSRVLKTQTGLLYRYESHWDEKLQISYTYPFDLSKGEGKILTMAEDDKEWKKVWDKRKFPFFVKFSFKYLVTQMRQTAPYMAMRYAREFSKVLKEDLKTFLSRSPAPEDRYVFFEGWGRRLVEELDLLWKLERITIV